MKLGYVHQGCSTKLVEGGDSDSIDANRGLAFQGFAQTTVLPISRSFVIG